MSNYSSLKATINANIKANGNQEITGPVMNSVLNAMVDSLGAGYQYMGKAVPSTNPGTPDAKVFYLASDPGTYTNFNGIVVADGEVAFLKWDSAWSKEVTGVATSAQLTQLGQKVDELSVEESLDLDEEIKVTTEDGQTTLIDITPNGVNAHNLKRDGRDVLTDQDISDLATKTELADGLAEKQDVIEEISIDDTHNSETEEQKWVSDDYDEDEGTGEEYARIDEYGVHAKCFLMLNGKKWTPLGDSFTAGATASTFADGKYKGKKKVYPYYIGNRTGLNIVDTFFASGRTLAFPANPGTFTNSICNPNAACYYQNIPADVDYITIYLGINDSHHAPGSGGGDGEDNTGEIPIGTIDDATTATYYGAWNVVLSWLIQNRPFAHIGILVSNGCDTVDYRTAQIAIARKYGIPFIDLNGDDRTPFMIRSTNPDIPSGIRSLRTQAQAVDYDGTQTGSVNLHPNDDAHLFESWFIEEFLKTI